jgi:hypothetical protein
MQIIFGIRFKPEDQMVGMDILGHGQTWNVQNLSSTSEVVMVTDAPPLVTQSPGKSKKRMSVRDVLHDAFT